MANYFYAPYLPLSAANRLVWLGNFATQIPNYSAIFVLTSQEQLDIQDSLIALTYGRTTLINYTRTYSKAVTAWADQLDTDSTPGASSPPPFNPTQLTALAISGIFKRLDEIIQARIMPTATDSQRTALGLNPIVTPSTVTPLITSEEAMIGGQVGLTMRRGLAKIIFIWSKRGTETQLTVLDKVASAHFLDTRPNLTPGKSEVREFAIEWSLDGNVGCGVLSPSVLVATKP